MLALCCVAAEGGGSRAVRAGLARARHQKRGALGGLPPYKLGHDIPVVTHSVLKPLVVTYPPAATVAAVKVPLSHPLLSRHPSRHPLVSPHQHHLHHHTKSVPLPHPEQHFHHHHHHVATRPQVPVLRVAQPATTVVHPLPPPMPAPVVPALATPLLPAATASVPAAPLLPAPLVPFAPQYSYVLRPGNAVQTSYFATYPRYPLASYRPLAPAPAPALLLPQPPAIHLQSHIVPQLLGVAPTPALLHPTQVDVSQAAVQVHHSLPESHAHIAPSSGQLPVAAHALEQTGWAPLDAGHSFFSQEAGTQVYEQHDGGEQVLRGYHDQLPPQQEQVHYDHHQLGHENAAPAHAPGPSAEYGQPDHEYDQQLLQHQQQHDHQFSQQFAQHDHQFAQHDQHAYEQQYAQHFEQHQQHPAASFEGQELQGRSAEEGEQRYHNHIPLGLQPPIDRPLEHFR